MHRLTAIATVCGLGAAALAFPVWSGMLGQASPASSSTDIAIDHAEYPDEGIAALRGCVANFSKDDCGGVIHPGDMKIYGCPGTDCKTMTMQQSVYRTRLRTSGGVCGISCLARCDDFGPETDGTLILKFDYTLRFDSCCPYRGFWDGYWEYVTDDGRLFKGTAHGTLGVGTNRASACFDTGDACERCYDVVFTGNQWQIAMEGSFQGRDSSGNLLQFTTDSTWTVKHDGTGGVFDQDFRVLGRYDGAFLLRCN